MGLRTRWPVEVVGMLPADRSACCGERPVPTSHSIVILYGPTWDAPSQMSKQHLARHWARHRRVLYVESPFNLFSFITRPAEARRLMYRYLKGPVPVGERLFLQTYAYLWPYRGGSRWTESRAINILNQAIVRPQLVRLCRRLGIYRPIVLAGSAHALPLLGGLNPALVVYHCSDDYTEQKTFPSSFAELERDLMARSDLVICTAEELRQAKAHLSPNVYTVPNGAEVAHFARTQDPQTEVAEELRRLPRPLVGYIGTIFEWLDQEMIAYAARARPDWSFVFVGPPGVDVSRLQAMPNIRFLGPRPYAELPRYLKGFDVAIVPFRFHAVTLRASPIKFYECLASGVPVVATRLPDFEPLAHLTELVTCPDEFVAALERAISNDTPEAKTARMTEARNHSWEARFALVDALIEEALAAKEARFQSDALRYSGTGISQA